MLIAPQPPLVSLEVVQSPMFPHSHREAFLDLNFILLVKYVIELGTLRYYVNNDSTMPSLPLIFRTLFQLSQLVRPLIQCGNLIAERRHT